MRQAPRTCRITASQTSRDPEAFSAVYRRLAPSAHAAALAVLRDARRRRTSCRTCSARSGCGPTSTGPSAARSSTFVQLMARSRALDRLRSRAAATAALNRGALEARAQPSTAEPPSETVIRRDSARAVLRELDQLPDGQRAAVLLHHVGGLSDGELARATQVPLGTAKSRIRLGTRARPPPAWPHNAHTPSWAACARWSSASRRRAGPRWRSRSRTRSSSGSTRARSAPVLRLYRPRRRSRSAASTRCGPGFAAAVAAAREHGFEPVLRAPGGHAVAYHDGMPGDRRGDPGARPDRGPAGPLRPVGRAARRGAPHARRRRPRGARGRRVLPRRLHGQRARRGSSSSAPHSGSCATRRCSPRRWPCSGGDALRDVLAAVYARARARLGSRHRRRRRGRRARRDGRRRRRRARCSGGGTDGEALRSARFERSAGAKRAATPGMEAGSAMVATRVSPAETSATAGASLPHPAESSLRGADNRATAAVTAATASTASSGARSSSATAAAATPASRASITSARPSAIVWPTTSAASRHGASSGMTATTGRGSARSANTTGPAPFSAMVATPTAATAIQAAISGAPPRR